MSKINYKVFPLGRRKIAAIALVFLLIGLVSVGKVLISRQPHQSRSSQVPITHVCSNPGVIQLSKAAMLLSPADVSQLQIYAHDIQKIPHYEQDPNCMYVVLTYYINITNTAKANTALALLEKINYSASQLSPYFTNEPTVKQLQAKLTNLNRMQQAQVQQIQRDNKVPYNQ